MTSSNDTHSAGPTPTTLKVLLIDNAAPGEANEPGAVRAFRQALEATQFQCGKIEARRCADLLSSNVGTLLFAERMKKACNEFDLAVAFAFPSPDETLGEDEGGEAVPANSGFHGRLWLAVGYWVGRQQKIGKIDAGRLGDQGATDAKIQSVLIFKDRRETQLPSNILGIDYEVFQDADLPASVEAALKVARGWSEGRSPRLPWRTLDLIRREFDALDSWPAVRFLESGYSAARRPCDLTLQIFQALAQETRGEKILTAISEFTKVVRSIDENFTTVNERKGETERLKEWQIFTNKKLQESQAGSPQVFSDEQRRLRKEIDDNREGILDHQHTAIFILETICRSLQGLPDRVQKIQTAVVGHESPDENSVEPWAFLKDFANGVCNPNSGVFEFVDRLRTLHDSWPQLDSFILSRPLGESADWSVVSDILQDRFHPLKSSIRQYVKSVEWISDYSAVRAGCSVNSQLSKLGRCPRPGDVLGLFIKANRSIGEEFNRYDPIVQS